MSDPSLRDQAVNAVAAYLNGSPLQVENYLYLAAAVAVDDVYSHRLTWLMRGIDLEAEGDG